MQFFCVKKNRFFNKKYEIEVHNDFFELKKNNQLKLKFQFYTNQQLKWVQVKGKLEGFIIEYKKNEVTFEMKHDDCQNFHDLIKGKIVFSNPYQFFKPIYEIGKGSYSNVLKVLSYQDQHMYACKCIEFQEPDQEQEILKEIQIQKSYPHEYIAKLISVFKSQKHYYLIMELPKGDTLRLFTRRKVRLSIDEVTTIMKQLLQAINYLHKNGIMHRDIKLDNILMDQNNDMIKLIDFGLATESQQTNQKLKICGTSGYVAPEVLQYDGIHSYNEKCDIFSVGIVLYYLLCSEMLFKGTTLEEIQLENYNFKKENYNFSNINFHFQNLLNLMLEENPNKRLSAQDSLILLNKIQQQIDEIPPESEGRIQDVPILLKSKMSSDPNLMNFNF